MIPFTAQFLCQLKQARHNMAHYWVVLLASLTLMSGTAVGAEDETVCARVKIEIKQELTLERQAFDAEMKISNSLDSGDISEVKVVVNFMDEQGNPVHASSDANDTSAKFFIRISNKQNISDVDGNGTVAAKSTAIINWLIIPAPGAAGANPFGKKYLVGAALTYKFGGETQRVDVSPDVIKVKPLPLLTLDYFLTQDVVADDPLTLPVEPTEPFTLGVRVKNNGYATAKNLKIESAQPKIIENEQGLLINFLLTGSYVNDAPVQNTLLIDFGDIAAATSKMGRWNMETTLAGKFTEFTAKFTHADELGGAMTSILQATNAHFLLRDVRVDLPGRDYVRDFLASDETGIFVYESDGPDTQVTDHSAVATLQTQAGSGNAHYKLNFPATAGFVFARLPDPYDGTKALGRVVRSDAKELTSDNAWLSKTRNKDTKKWEYWINFFDVNSTGSYDSEFQAPSANPRPPVVQFVPERIVNETKQVSFLVEASSPDGRPVALTAAPLPAGATFVQQAADPQLPGHAIAIFDWTPPAGSAGDYLITYTAQDGVLSGARSARIKVETETPPPGPGTPTIVSPLSGAQVTSLKPILSVQTSTQARDPSTHVQFEVFADEAETQLVASETVEKAPLSAGNGAGSVQGPTSWTVTATMQDNTPYWWRARAFDGTVYSAWSNARFFVNTFNDPPDAFNLASPAPNAEVDSVTPTLSWTNSHDKDGDIVRYRVDIFADAALTETVLSSPMIEADASGTTHWLLTQSLVNHSKYYWRVVAEDGLGAQMPSSARPFIVNTGNVAPTAPVVLSPADGGQSPTPTTVLTIQNSVDADRDLVTYIFELDSVNTFDSGDKRSSGPVIASSSGSTSWAVVDLIENKRYWWRIKAQDGRAESEWVVAHFLMNAQNEVPSTPSIRNPGNESWVASQQPSLEANPVEDPEEDRIRYHFEVYKDSGLTQRVVDDTSINSALLVAEPLVDKTTYWWRVRAVDAHNGASDWSLPAKIYVSTAPYQEPTVAVTSPATPIQPEIVQTPDGERKQVTLRWEGTDPNIEPTIGVYYDRTGTGFAGSLIVDGLRQSAGTQSGSYVWDVTGLSTGTYYVYAVIYDAKGVGRAYAPGAVVIAPAQQKGSVTITANTTLQTNEAGKTVTFYAKLGSMPAHDVVLNVASSNPKEGVPNPAVLTFTPQNWSVRQKVTVAGQNDCVVDGNQTYSVTAGNAQSRDPNYIGVSGRAVSIVNVDSKDLADTTDNAAIHLCRLRIISETQISDTRWEYVVSADMTNVGDALSGLVAKLIAAPKGLTIEEDILIFGAAGTGETVRTGDTIKIVTKRKYSASKFTSGVGFKWQVTTQP